MRAFDKLRLRFRSLFRRHRVEHELEHELRFHLDHLIEENIAAGMGPGEARAAALRALGGVSQLQEECRDMRKVNFMDDFLRDLRYAGRSLRRSPGFAALAILIMALGIGANTAVFSVVNAVLLKPLALNDPARIVAINGVPSKEDASDPLSKQVSIVNVWDWHDQATSFEAMAFYASRETSVATGTTAEYARAARVSRGFYDVFAVKPVVGRIYTAEEDKQLTGASLLISYDFWKSHFGGDPNIPGKSIRIYGRTGVVSGVMPPGFHFPGDTDFWSVIPRETRQNRGAHNFLAVGRLKQGVTLEQAQAQMDAITRHIEQQYPDENRTESAKVTRLRDDMVGNVRLTLYLLWGGVSVVVLIACANTATLLLGKAAARSREVAVRFAMGASRQRIVRQMITECLLLAGLAGALGLLFAYWGSAALVALAPANLPRVSESGIDGSVLAFTLFVSIATSVVFGLVPALYVSRSGPHGAMKQGGTRSIIGGGLARMRGSLVIAEVALAVVLLSAAGLLLKSFAALSTVALGFRPENVLVMRATVSRLNTPEEVRRANQYFTDVLAQTRALPGVIAAGATMAPPGYVDSTGSYSIDRIPDRRDPAARTGAVLSIIAPGTFAALGIPVTRGREFREADTPDAPMVAIVNEAIVRNSLRGQDPIGRTVFCAFDTNKPMTIVGVVGDVRQYGPAREPQPECYMPYMQHAYNGNTLSFVVRTSGEPAALAETVRKLARERSPDVPMKFTTMEAAIAENVATPRFRSLLFGVFAALAVSLAMAGVYGVMAFSVTQRSSEIGLRMALGATATSVLRLILGQGFWLAAVGLAIGLGGAFAATRLLETMLFEVKPNDPTVYVAVGVLLAAVTLLAGLIPARRASKIDPLEALRQE